MSPGARVAPIRWGSVFPDRRDPRGVGGGAHAMRHPVGSLLVGGSWFVPSAALDAGDFDEIRRLSCRAQALIPD